MELAGRPLIAWCLDAFAAATAIERAVVAAPAAHLEQISGLAPAGLELEAVSGGATRADSVAAALEHAETEIVVVHDAARPLVTSALIEQLIEVLAAAGGAAGVIAARPLTDTVKRVKRGKREVARTERRDELWAAQTPQVFRVEALRGAHDASSVGGEATDDAMLVEQAGGLVLVEPGPVDNIKVTTPEDLRLAELLIRTRLR